METFQEYLKNKGKTNVSTTNKIPTFSEYMASKKSGVASTPTPAPAFNYRQGAVPYSTLSANAVRTPVEPIPAPPAGVKEFARELVSPRTLYESTPIPKAIKGAGMVTGAVSGLFGAVAGAIKEYDRQVTSKQQIIPSSTTGSTPMAILPPKEPTKLDTAKIYNSAVDYAKESYKVGSKAGEAVSPWIAGFALTSGVAPTIAKIAGTALGTYITAQGVQTVADEYGRVDEEAKMGNIESKALSSAYKKGGTSGLQLFGIEPDAADALADTPWGAAIGNGLLFIPGIASIIATPKVMRGTAEASKLKFTNLTKDTLKKYNVPTTVDVPADVVFDWQTGRNKIPIDASWDTALKSLTAKERAVAARNGVKITLPLEYVVKLVDKPYWANIKDKFGLTPTNKEIARGFESGTTQINKVTTPVRPTAELTTPAMAGRIAAPTAPTSATNVAFQIPNAGGTRTLYSGPVVNPKQQKISSQVATSPTRLTAETPVLRPTTTERFSTMTKPETLENLEKNKDIISKEIYKETKALIAKNIAPTFIFEGRNITGVKDSGKTIKGEVKIQAKTPKTGKIQAPTKPQVVSKGTSIQPENKIKPVITRTEGKPITIRQAAVIKREVKLTKAQQAAANLKMVKEERAKNAKYKTYEERLRAVKLKKEASKIAEAKSIKNILLEKVIEKKLKAGTMTKEEAIKAREKGKFNTITKKIDYSKITTPKEFKDAIYDAEKVEHIDEVEIRNKEYELREIGYRLLKKYMKKLNVRGIVSEKYVPRGVAGSVDEYFAVKLKAINDISTLTHELVHIIDRGLDIRKKITDSKVIEELTSAYKKYYPRAKKNPDQLLAIKEGLSSFFQQYALKPTATSAEFPLLKEAFLDKDGIYHEPFFNELVSDLKLIVGDFQALDALNKIGSKLAQNPFKYDLPSFYNSFDKSKMWLSHDQWLMEKLSIKAKIDRTVQDPLPYMARYPLAINIINHNMTRGGKLFKVKKEDYRVLANEQGDYLPKEDFNLATIAESLKKGNKTKDFSKFLFAGDIEFTYKLVDNFKKSIAEKTILRDEKKLEYLSTQDKEIKKEVKALEKEIEIEKEYLKTNQQILSDRGIPRELVVEALEKNKQRFTEETKMFKKLLQVRLDTYLLNRMITPELHKIYSENIKMGYAPASVEVINDLQGSNEISRFLKEEMMVMNKGNRYATKIKNLISRKGARQSVIAPWKNFYLTESSFQMLTARQFIANKVGEVSNLYPFNQVMKPAPYFPGIESNPNIITWIDKDYKKQALEVDPLIKKVFDVTFTPKRAGALQKIALILPAKIGTASITSFYVAFAGANIFLDSGMSMFTSKNNLIPIVTPVRQMIKVFINDPATKPYALEYLNNIKYSQSMLSGISKGTAEEAAELMTTGFNSKLEKYTLGIVDKGASVLGFLGQVSELLTRMPEYIKSRQHGNSQAVATLDASRISGAYGEHGLISNYTKSAIYLNPALKQGDLYLETMARMIKQAKGTKSEKDKTNVIAKFVAVQTLYTLLKLMGLATIVYQLKNAVTDDEKEKAIQDLQNYNNKTEYERFNYLRDPFTHKFGVRVPNQYGAIPNLAEMVAADNFLNSNYTPKEYLKWFVDASPYPLQWTRWIPYVANLGLISIGFKTFPTFKKLEPYYMETMAPENRANRGTTDFAKWLGNTDLVKGMNLLLPNEMKISPIKIDEYVKWTGRGGHKQWFGEWDSKKSLPENMINSFAQTFKDAFVEKNFLFSGREYDKFYEDAKTLGWDVSKQKKLAQVVQDPNLYPELIASASKQGIYNGTIDIISALRDIDNAKIEIDLKYKNYIGNIIIYLNHDKLDKAKSELMNLVKDGGFGNFLSNSLRLIKEQENASIKEKYEKGKQSKGDIFWGVKVANAAEIDMNYGLQRETTSIYNNTLRAQAMPLTTNDAKIEVYAKNIKVIPKTGVAVENNNPGNLEFHGQPNAVKNGRWAKFTTPEIGFRALMKDIQSKQKKGLTIKQAIKIYAPSTENNTNKYIAELSRLIGANANDKLDKFSPIEIAKYIAKLESNTTIEEI